MKVLIIAAHPDDAEISMGMRIANHVQNGDEVRIHCVTKGAPPGGGEIRKEEARKAGEVLGVKNYSFSDIEDGLFIEQRKKIRNTLEKIIAEEKPDLLYTHYYKDKHLDHVVTSEEALIAGKAVPNFFYFKSPYASFKPNIFYFGTSREFEQKDKALKFFETQLDRQLIEVVKKYSNVIFYEHLEKQTIASVSKGKKTKELFVELFKVERLIL
ncbi:MAG: PIG-L family deacetylase [Patescibacteria group bacterium]|nr:PIG-L family deacetylase [Patescibacteria group bacterium]